MTRRVLRYRLGLISHEQTVRAPAGPVIDVELDTLGVGINATEVVDLWIDGEGPDVARTFQIFGTGAPLPDWAVHVGSATRHGGFKWHLYELREGQ